MRVLALVPAVLLAGALPRSASADDPRLEQFEQEVEALRERLRIPGLSAVVLKDQEVLWTRGFGYADLENRIPATPDTLYSIASLTKTFAATVVMQLVEQGKLDLEEPISRYSSDFKDDSVRIKHLISHTAGGTPGERYQYDGGLYAYLTPVIEKHKGKPFVEVLVETFLDPLQMTASVPYHDVVEDADKWKATLGQDHIDRYRRNLAQFSRPYTYYGAGEIFETTYPPRDPVDASAGLLSTVRDLAKYDIAIDRHVFLRKETQERAWTPFVSNAGERLPYGLGWFVTDWHGTRLIWHYGHWGTGFSAMYVKIPSENVSMVLLANSEALGDIGWDGLLKNAFVCRFLGLWGHAHDCRQQSEAALAQWIEKRRASARVPIAVPAEILESYVGRYQFEQLDNRIYDVLREGDKLYFRPPEGTKLELFAESETRFFLKVRTYTLVFSRAPGQLPQLQIVEGDQTVRSKRLP